MNDTNDSIFSPFQGWKPDIIDEKDRIEALELAFDYRGDVTLTLRDNRVIKGFLFDRKINTSLADSYARILPTTSHDFQTVAFDEIAEIKFTGRDAAAGKTWERWIKTYIEKKKAGLSADLHPDALEDA